MGRTTEGYRSLLEAVRRLGGLPGDGPRTLLVLSDGLFEDRAYFHRDVVEAAHEAGVVIHALGYSRSVSLSVALQTLRRLAEETGGLYSAARPGAPLPAAFVQGLLAGVNGGGRVVIDLAPGIAASRSGGVEGVRLELVTPDGIARATVPVEVPAPLPPVTEPVVVLPAGAPLSAPLPAPEAPPPAVPPGAPSSMPAPDSTPAPETRPASAPPSAAPPPAAGDEPYGLPTLAWIAAGAAAGTALLVAALLLARRRRPPRPAAAPPPALDTLAWLEAGDGGARYAVRSALFRIGRHAGNDLVLDDASISRYHAELQRHRDGGFSIRDLDSLNGVFINGDRVDEGVVSDGDTLEIGDVALRFHGDGPVRLPGEDTVILKTAVPSRPMPGSGADRPH